MNAADTALLALLRAALHGEKPADPAPVPAGAGSSGPSTTAGAGVSDGVSTPRKCHSERSEESASPVPADPVLTPEDWQALLRRAEAHKLLPLILDTAWPLRACRAALGRSLSPGGKPSRPEAVTDAGSPAGAGSSGPTSPDWKSLALSQVARQVTQENEFLNLILALRARGLEPVVMKGCVCRALWPKPLLRPSVDDDLLIPPDQAPAFHAALLELGLTPDDPAADPETAWELSYHKPNSPLYIELHKRLFEPGSDALLGFNEPFDGALDRAVSTQIQDVTLLTLAPADHLLFLLLHAFKHFLYSGFGLRIVSDVCLYARRYAADIDFDRVLASCASLRCGPFAAALFRIGEKWLGLPAPAPFAASDVDETALLEDVLAAGLVGADIDRLHSANITLGAVAAQNTGKAPAGGLRGSVFLSAKQLSGRYPWLEKRPWLLPAAWVSRVRAYLKERGKYGAEDPVASLRIGKERVELLKTYGIIDE